MPGSDTSTPTGQPGWYSYAVVRAVPRVERGEFVNVGIVLFARTMRFLEARFELDVERLRALHPEVDIEALERHLEIFRGIAAGDAAAGPIAQQSPSERFHWLTAPRSTIIQTSETHVGRCHDPSAALDDLMARLVHTSA